MEGVDVEDGVYPAVFLHDGTVLEASTYDGRVLLRDTGRRDPGALGDRLSAYERRIGRSGGTPDPLGYANDWLRQEWDRRWPTWPEWLSRRLHGAAPEQVADDRP